MKYKKKIVAWLIDLKRETYWGLETERKSRIHVPGGLYHVMLRGNEGEDIFFSNEDRYHLYLLLQEGIEIKS